jgi:hypothetical protein
MLKNRILNGKSQMEDGKKPVVFPSAIFHSTLGRAFFIGLGREARD